MVRQIQKQVRPRSPQIPGNRGIRGNDCRIVRDFLGWSGRSPVNPFCEKGGMHALNRGACTTRRRRIVPEVRNPQCSVLLSRRTWKRFLPGGRSVTGQGLHSWRNVEFHTSQRSAERDGHFPAAGRETFRDSPEERDRRASAPDRAAGKHLWNAVPAPGIRRGSA